MKTMSDTRLFVVTTALSALGIFLLSTALDYRWISAVIVVHVLLGSLAFLIGGVSLFSTKGSPLHKTSGKLFYVSMTVSVALTLLVSIMPFHTSPSLFQIGVLSLYFLIGGKRSILFKQSTERLLIDRLLAITVISVSIIVLSSSVILYGEFYPLRTVFGSLGIAFGLIDLLVFRNPQLVKKRWLLLHLSKMIGGYTAAVTAFFVAQDFLGGYYNWFTPTVFGLAYIILWSIKLRVFKPTRQVRKTVNAT